MTNDPAPRPFSKAFAYTLSFMGGFHVMAIEMCAFRSLQWTFGSSIYVSGSLLTLIMVALALGYRLGGGWSARTSSLRPLFIGLLLAVAYLGLTSHLFLTDILTGIVKLRTSFDSLVARYSVPPALTTVVLYFPPMLALSMVSPFLARALLSRQKDASEGGLTIGTVMAVSTLGSVSGTMLASYVMVPYWGTDRTLMAIEASTLVVAGIGLFGEKARFSRALAVAALVLAVVRPALPQAQVVAKSRPPMGDLAFAEESLYGPVALYATEHEELGTQVSFMSSYSYVHSIVFPKNPAGDVFSTEHIAPGVALGKKRYLILGAALGGAITALIEHDPQAQVVAVEIDPLVATLAKRHMPVLSGPNVEWAVEDARAFLVEDARTYDVVLVDVLSDQQIPGHCVTKEFFELVRRHLAPGGVLQVNTNMVTFDGKVQEQAAFSPLRHVVAAIHQAGFEQVLVNDFFETGELVAFEKPVDVAQLRGSLKTLALDEKAAKGMQAAAAVLALNLQPLPRTNARALSDDWFIEHLLHLRDTWGLTFGGLREASRDAAWRRNLEAQAQTDLLAQVSLRLADALTSPEGRGRSTEATLDLFATPSFPVCDDLYARAQKPGWLRQFSLAVHASIAASCARRTESVPAPPASEATDYFTAAEALGDNRLSQAVPPLQRLLASAEWSTLDVEPSPP